MILGTSYFALPLPFARRAAALTGIAADEAFRLYTPWYSFLAHDNDVGSDRQWRQFDPAHPGWRAFVAAMRAGADPVDYVYARAVASLPPDYGAHGRDFTYDWWAESRTVRLHFANNTPGGLALRDDAVPQRMAELRDVCTEVATQHPEAERVRGASWLYHLPKYRRLFPPEYIAALEPIGYEYQFLALWGQLNGPLCPAAPTTPVPRAVGAVPEPPRRGEAGVARRLSRLCRRRTDDRGVGRLLPLPSASDDLRHRALFPLLWRRSRWRGGDVGAVREPPAMPRLDA